MRPSTIIEPNDANSAPHAPRPSDEKIARAMQNMTINVIRGASFPLSLLQSNLIDQIVEFRFLMTDVETGDDFVGNENADYHYPDFLFAPTR